MACQGSIRGIQWYVLDHSPRSAVTVAFLLHQLLFLTMSWLLCFLDVTWRSICCLRQANPFGYEL